MKQKAFTKEYADELMQNIETNLGLYIKDGFDYKKDAVVDLHFDAPDNLLEDMRPYISSSASIEVDAAIKLYEAYKDLTPLEASYKPFWLYLSHVTLYPYMYQRWIEDQEIDNFKSCISTHWFYKNGVLRSHLEGMYWLVRKTVQYNKDDVPDYKYTRFLFSRRVLGDRGLAARQFIFQNDHIFKGVLKYIMENEDTIFAHHMQARATYCAVLLNNIGGVVELSTWNEEDVKKFLNQHKSSIEIQDND